MRTLTSSIALLAGMLAAGAAWGQSAPAVPSEAQALFDSGAALTAEHRYREAAQAFEASFEKDARKEALFAWAQVERLGGNCLVAIDLYRRFLAQPDLAEAQREAAELNIRRCETTPPPPVATRTEARPPPAVLVTRSATPPAAPPPGTRSRAAVVVGVALLGGAVSGLAGSVTLLVLARNDERRASSATIWDDYHVAARRARERQRLAAGLLGAGAVLGSGALLEWLLTAPEPRLAAWVGPQAAGLRGRF